MTALAVQDDYALLRQQAADLCKTGFLPKAVDTPEKAIAIKMMSDALGIHWIVGLQGINVIGGKPTVSPQLMMALVYRSRQLEHFEWSDDGTTSTVKMKRVGQPLHVETFSMEDARRLKTTEWDGSSKRTISLADKSNWQQQPKTMRKWRAIAAACRIVFPDVTWGIASYTPEEMGADVTYNDDGSIADIVEPPVIEPANGRPSEKPQITSPQITSWYDDPHLREQYLMWLHDKRSMGEPEAERLVGKPARAFASGREACLAVDDAIARATSPGGHWADDPEQFDRLRALLAGFELQPEQALKRLRQENWKVYPTLAAAQEAVLHQAADEDWPMIATAAHYYEYGNPPRRLIRFNTPRLTVWYAGRHELIDAIRETRTATQQEWEAILHWELQTGDLTKTAPLPLPEKVRITPRQGKNVVEAVKIESAETIPF